ncbi:MAG: chemotaxis protein CheW [Planctomycetota bacterium]
MPVPAMSVPADPAADSKALDLREKSQFVEFVIDGRRCAFPISQIREIGLPGKYTPTPHVAPCVDGVANLRGDIIPMINLRILFGLPRKPHDPDTRVIVVHSEGKLMGCLVDTVNQVVAIPNANIKPAPDAIFGNGGHAIIGFAEVEDRILIVLDVDRLLAPEHLHAET